jgi:hypothetical protein
MSPLALDESPPAFTPWCITVALNGELRINVPHRMTMSNGVDRFQCEIPLSNWVSLDRVCRPSDLLATVCLEVYASFEFQPTLGAGEQLRKLTITVEQLLDRSAKDVRKWDRVLHKGLGTHTMAAYTLFPEDGDVVSPCSSISVSVKRRKWKCENSDSSASRVFGPYCVSSELC